MRGAGAGGRLQPGGRPQHHRGGRPPPAGRGRGRPLGPGYLHNCSVHSASQRWVNPAYKLLTSRVKDQIYTEGPRFIVLPTHTSPSIQYRPLHTVLQESWLALRHSVQSELSQLLADQLEAGDLPGRLGLKM